MATYIEDLLHATKHLMPKTKHQSSIPIAPSRGIKYVNR